MAIAKLSIDFEARLGQFETELKRISTVANSVSSNLTSAFKGIGLAMAGLGAGVGLSTLKDKFDAAIASASQLKEMADKTGASVENISGLGAVAKVTATDMGLVTAAMNKLSKGLHASDDDAKGTGKALEFLGLKLKDLRGKDSAENLKLVADKMADVEDGTGKVALAMALFGKNGAEMLASMRDLAQSGDLVVKTTEAQAIAAKNYEEDLRRLQATKEALYKTVALELAPVFDTFVRALIGAKNETNGMIQTGKELAADGSIREWGMQAVKVAGFVIDAFDGVARVVKGIGITLGAAAAQASALSGGDFAAYKNIGKEWRSDLDALANKPLFSQKLQVQTDALRAHWSQVEAVKKAYANFPKDIQNKALKSLEESYYGTAGGTKSASGFTAAADPRNAKSGAGAAKVDDYTKIIQSLNEKISVETAALDSTEKLNTAQKDYAKYQADIASGAVKLTGAQRSVIDAYYQVYLARATELVSNGFVSKADLDRRTATRDAALARVKVAEAQYNEQRARIGRLDIRAPAAGLVLTRSVEPGQIISSASGVLFRIAKGGEMELIAKLSEVDLAALAVGDRVDITPVGGKQVYTGHVWQISPVIDPQTRLGMARIVLPYHRDIRPGGFASARIVSGTAEAPVLPESAIQHDDKGSFVYIANAKNIAERRDVKIGQVSAAGVSIVGGLNGTERVIALAGGFLSAGQKVEPQAEQPSGGAKAAGQGQ